MEIAGFEPRLAASFDALNRRWIEELFVLEGRDEQIFADPQHEVIDAGGQIFFALEEGEAVGCVALIPRSKEEVELTKMAVDPRHQRKGIGRELLRRAIRWSTEKGASRLSLQSSTRLHGALALYESMGFRVSRRGPHPEYERSDIGMELSLPVR